MLLQEDASEFLDESKLKDLVAKYSEFINFPIYLYSSKEVSNMPQDSLASLLQQIFIYIAGQKMADFNVCVSVD